MAKRASRDPEDLLRAHFSAEIAAERLAAPPPPELEEGFRAEESAKGADRSRRRGPSLESARIRPRELAAAAVLVLAFGFGIWATPAETGFSRALAKNALGDGRALEVCAFFSRGVSAAVTAFARSARDGSGAGGARRAARFK